jgi:hypothetical protein
MRKLHRRFESWRRAHPGRRPIPEPLWTAAAELAKKHGVFRTAQTLCLDYNRLKRRVGSAGPVARHTPPPAAFVELLAPPTAGLAECLVELEGPRGRMRIQWKGTTAPDLAGLGRALWEPA